MKMAGTVCEALYLNKWVVVALVPLVILLVYVRNYFLTTSTEIKRIDGISKLIKIN